MSDINEKYIELLQNMKMLIETSPWVMRIKETTDGVCLQLFERQKDDKGQTVLKKWGELSGSKLRVCKAPIRHIISEVLDTLGNPLGLQTLIGTSIDYRGDVPLSKEAGTKLALMSILIQSVNIEPKVELLAWRIERFSVEEASYWFGKATIPVYGEKAMKWYIIGMRVMLAGPTDQKVSYDDLLEKLRR